MVTIALLKIIECWNSYVWPRLITDDQAYFLVSNGIQEIRENGFGRENIPAMMAAVVVISAPLIALFLIFLIFYACRPNPAVHPNWRLILLTPLILIQLGLLGLGFGVIVAALTTKYRDLAMLVTFGVQLWMYATPVTYSSSMIADKFPNLLGLYMLNPITPIIELFRAAFLGAADYSLTYNALSMGVTLLVAALGVVLFSHTEKTFMDTV